MPVTVEIDGSRISLKGWAGSDTKFKCKAVPGATARWDKTVHPNKFICWTYPIDLNTCLELRRQFGTDLVIGKKLWAWAKEERKRRDKVTDILKQTSFDLPKVAAASPKLAAAMEHRTYQQVGSAFIGATRQAIIADDPGLGKTLQVMGAVVEAGITGPLLVLAPSAAVQITWPTELATWLPEDRVYVATGNRSQRANVIASHALGCQEEPDRRHWLICNYEMARANTGMPKVSKLAPEPGPHKWSRQNTRTGKTIKGFWHHPYAYLFNVRWEAITCDESQKALITKTSKKEDQSQVRAGCGMLKTATDGLRIAASGTPFRGKTENLWGTLNWLQPDVYNSFWNWVRSWFNIIEAEYSIEIGGLQEGKEDKFYRDLDAIMIRRRKSEVVKELPEKQYAGSALSPGGLHGIWLEMDSKQKKAYKEMVEEAASNLDSGTLMASGVLAELTRLKQFATCYGDIEVRTRMQKIPAPEFSDKEPTFEAEDYTAFVPTLPSNKYDWIVNWLEERGHFDGEQEAPVVIASQFTQIINLFRYQLKKDFGLESHIITGETKAKDRKAHKEAFQDGTGYSVFFLNTDAGGTSLTLDAADDLIFLDEKWIPDDQTQVEDRIHRVSRMHQVTIWYLRSLDTIEQHIASVNAERDEMQLKILDGRRGVDYAKKLLMGAV
jgi:SNF2 family DNA or RNA helicase